MRMGEFSVVTMSWIQIHGSEVWINLFILVKHIHSKNMLLYLFQDEIDCYWFYCWWVGFYTHHKTGIPVGFWFITGDFIFKYEDQITHLVCYCYFLCMYYRVCVLKYDFLFCHSVKLSLLNHLHQWLPWHYFSNEY